MASTLPETKPQPVKAPENRRNFPIRERRNVFQSHPFSGAGFWLDSFQGGFLHFYEGAKSLTLTPLASRGRGFYPTNPKLHETPDGGTCEPRRLDTNDM